MNSNDMTEENIQLNWHVDNLAKSLVEGCIFINPSDRCIHVLSPGSGIINDQSVHLCSNMINPGYNDGQRIAVKLIIDPEIERADTKNIQDEPRDINIESNINVYCYDTRFSSIDFSLVGNSNGLELSDMIDHAEVTVRYNGNDSESKLIIECTDIKHRLCPRDLLVMCKNDYMYKSYDYRSTCSNKYCVHKDNPIDTNIYSVIQKYNDQEKNIKSFGELQVMVINPVAKYWHPALGNLQYSA